MSRITLDEAAALLKEHDKFKILTHTYPDGDTLGCAYALCYALRKLGKHANIAVDGKLPLGKLVEIEGVEDYSTGYQRIVALAQGEVQK